jgi:hypothetical protein
MKKLIVILVISFGVITLNAQGLFEKINRSNFVILNTDNSSFMFSNTEKPTVVRSVISDLNVWRMTYGITAFSFNLKTGETGWVSSTGIGLARANFKLNSKGEPYQTWNVGAMLLLGNKESNTLLTTGGSADIGALISGGLGVFNIGPAYFFASKTLLLNFKVDFTYK